MAKTLSVDELREGIRQQLKSRGALRQLKTQLRAMVLTDLASSGALHEPRQAWAEVPADSKENTSTQTIEGKLADALIECHLRNSGRSYAHSIFVSEADIASPCNESEICAMLKLSYADVSSSHKSPLSLVVAERLSLEARREDVATTSQQTDEPCTTQTLEQRFAVVDAQYALRANQHSQMTRRDFELSVKRFQDDTLVRIRRDVEAESQKWKEDEIVRLRQEERDRYETLLRVKYEELAEKETAANQRIQLEQHRIDDIRKDLALRAADVERRSNDMLAEFAERDRAVSELRAELQAQRSKGRSLTQQIAQYEEMLADRLQELQTYKDRERRRGDDVLRLSGEHARELRMRDEEIANMKFRLQQPSASEIHALDQTKPTIKRTDADAARCSQQARVAPAEPSANSLILKESKPAIGTHEEKHVAATTAPSDRHTCADAEHRTPAKTVQTTQISQGAPAFVEPKVAQAHAVSPPSRHFNAEFAELARMEEMRRSDALSAEEVERHKLTQCEHLARQAMHIVHEESGERDTLHQTEDQAYKELQWVVSRERDALTRKDAEDIAFAEPPILVRDDSDSNDSKDAVDIFKKDDSSEF